MRSVSCFVVLVGVHRGKYERRTVCEKMGRLVSAVLFRKLVSASLIVASTYMYSCSVKAHSMFVLRISPT
jgi:hypothetical protein